MSSAAGATGTENGPPPFDPELSAALAAIQQHLPPTITRADIPGVRAAMQAMDVSDEELTFGGRFDVRQMTAPGLDGTPGVPLLVCRPTAATTPVGAIFYTHGGGMMMGSARGFEVREVLGWAAELGLALISVEYRLAPEHPYPAQIEDCYAGLVWTAAHAGELGIDSARIVAAGASAGGGLTAALTLLIRDRGGPALAGQMLLEPMLDDRCDTPSNHQMAGLGIWDRDANLMGWGALLGELRGGPDVPCCAAPARAEDLSALPPTYIDVGSAETFRDESVDFASRLWLSGGAAELHVWPGGFHGYDVFVPQSALSQATRMPRIEWLRRVLRF